MPALLLACVGAAVLCLAVQWTLHRPRALTMSTPKDRDEPWSDPGDGKGDAWHIGKPGPLPKPDPKPEQREEEDGAWWGRPGHLRFPTPTRGIGFTTCPKCSAINNALSHAGSNVRINSRAIIRVRDEALWCAVHGMFHRRTAEGAARWLYPNKAA